MRGIATPTIVWSSAAKRSPSATPTVASTTWGRDEPSVMTYLLCFQLASTVEGYCLLRQDPFRNRIQARNKDAEHLGPAPPRSDPARDAPRLVRRTARGAPRSQRQDGPQRRREAAGARLPGGGGVRGGGRLPARRRGDDAAAAARWRGGRGDRRGAQVFGGGRGFGNRGNLGPGVGEAGAGLSAQAAPAGPRPAGLHGCRPHRRTDR